MRFAEPRQRRCQVERADSQRPASAAIGAGHGPVPPASPNVQAAAHETPRGLPLVCCSTAQRVNGPGSPPAMRQTRGLGRRGTRQSRPVSWTLLLFLWVSWAPGCMPNHETSLEFEGFAAAGQKFRIVRELSRRGLPWPISDRLNIAWPQQPTVTADPSTGPGADPTAAAGPAVVTRCERLVRSHAEQRIGFRVRSADNRIWLITPGGKDVFAAIDLETAQVFPDGVAPPPWANAQDGMWVDNLAPSALASSRLPALRAPPETLDALDGSRLTLSASRPGVTLLSFFGVSCAPCRLEAPHLAALQQQYRDQGLRVVCVNAWNDTPSDVREYARQFGLPPSQVLLNGKNLASQLAADGVPKSLWINADGWVVDIQSGFGADGAAQLQARTRKAMGIK